jgi:hypothetical protein
MSEEEFEREVAGRFAVDRRAFIKKMVVGAAFAAPVIASFNMVGLGAGTAHGSITSNTSGICNKLEKQLQGVNTAYNSLPPNGSARARAILNAERQAIKNQQIANHCP